MVDIKTEVKPVVRVGFVVMAARSAAAGSANGGCKMNNKKCFEKKRNEMVKRVEELTLSENRERKLENIDTDTW